MGVQSGDPAGRRFPPLMMAMAKKSVSLRLQTTLLRTNSRRVPQLSKLAGPGSLTIRTIRVQTRAMPRLTMPR
jgi:hypothetical protein